MRKFLSLIITSANKVNRSCTILKIIIADKVYQEGMQDFSKGGSYEKVWVFCVNKKRRGHNDSVWIRPGGVNANNYWTNRYMSVLQNY